MDGLASDRTPLRRLGERAYPWTVSQLLLGGERNTALTTLPLADGGCRAPVRHPRACPCPQCETAAATYPRFRTPIRGQSGHETVRK